VPRATLLPTLLSLVVPLAIGCRTASPASSSLTAASVRSGVRGPTDVLGYTEIRTARLNTAHEAVMRFRPDFLRRRAEPAPTDPNVGLPVVYLDGVRQGGTDALRTIPAGVIFEIRYLSAAMASDQFGPYYPGGVIAVRTRP
jgi:hypothetical protein